jgi:hypothetical protein
MIQLDSITKQLSPVIDRTKGRVLFPTKAIECYDSLPSTGDVNVEYLIGDEIYSYDGADFVLQNSFTSSNPTNLFFHRSTYREFVDIMVQFKDQKDRFPLIFLNSPTIDIKIVGDLGYATLGQIIIATSSLPNLTSDIREVQSFRTILRPLSNMFLDSLRVLGMIDEKTEINIKEHFFYGNLDDDGVSGNLFSDYVDAIEIKNLKIKLKTNC